MPSEAQESFTRLKRILCSQPVLAFPCPDKQYALIVDASTGAKDFEGGLCAILTQMDAHGRFSVIAYASRFFLKIYLYREVEKHFINTQTQELFNFQSISST